MVAALKLGGLYDIEAQAGCSLGRMGGVGGFFFCST